MANEIQLASTELAEGIAVSFEPAVITADFDSMRAKVEGLLESCAVLDLEEGQVFSLDEKVAKATRAELNRYSKELNDARKRIKAAYSEPLIEFEAKVKELDEIIKRPIGIIDAQIKAQEEKAKAERYAALEAAYVDFCTSNGFEALLEAVPYERIHIPQWCNKTYGAKKAENELQDAVAVIMRDYHTLQKLTLYNPQAAGARFFQSLSVDAVIREDEEEYQRMEAAKAVHEAVCEAVIEAEEYRQSPHEEPVYEPYQEPVFEAPAYCEEHIQEEEPMLDYRLRITYTMQGDEYLRELVMDIKCKRSSANELASVFRSYGINGSFRRC